MLSLKLLASMREVSACQPECVVYLCCRLIFLGKDMLRFGFRKTKMFCCAFDFSFVFLLAFFNLRKKNCRMKNKKKHIKCVAANSSLLDIQTSLIFFTLLAFEYSKHVNRSPFVCFILAQVLNTCIHTYVETFFGV